MRELYPAIEPYRTGMLKVSDIHSLYYEESGNPNGQPIVFLHGGPGGGTDASFRRFFDPAHYHIILFDQRGAGKSTPHASLEENTTWDLVSDIELVREHLGIEQWMVFGGSWGSTLALAYCEEHPERVTHIILRGIFLLRKSEIDWLYQFGASELFPDFWEDYLKPIPVAERGDMVKVTAPPSAVSNTSLASCSRRPPTWTERRSSPPCGKAQALVLSSQAPSPETTSRWTARRSSSATS